MRRRPLRGQTASGGKAAARRKGESCACGRRERRVPPRARRRARTHAAKTKKASPVPACKKVSSYLIILETISRSSKTPVSGVKRWEEFPSIKAPAGGEKRISLEIGRQNPPRVI